MGNTFMLCFQALRRNDSIQLAVITQINPLGGYDFAIDPIVLEGQKTYYWQIKPSIIAGKIGDGVSGNSHNLRDSLPDDSIGSAVISFRQENLTLDIVNSLLLVLRPECLILIDPPHFFLYKFLIFIISP